MNLLLIFILTIFGSSRDLNEKGNKLYHNGKYTEALDKYKKAQVKDPKNMLIDYNIGCGQYKTSTYQDAVQAFTRIVSSLEDKNLKQKAIYNMGNVLFKSGNLENSIEMYKQALRMNPDDMDAKINLELAQKKLEEQQKQNQDKNQQNKQDKQQQKQQQKQEENKQNKEQQEKEKKEQEQKMSQESAKNILESLQQDEKDAKEKSEAKGKQGKIAVEKDW